MANTFKLKTKANVGITTQNVYVVPSATTTVVIGITLANVSGSGCLVGVGITRPSTDDVKVLKCSYTSRIFIRVYVREQSSFRSS